MNTKTIKKAVTKRAVKTIPQNLSPEASVLSTLSTALDKGVDADSLEKILNMQERILDRQADQAFALDMVMTQGSVKAISKNRNNDQTTSKYANLEAVLKAIVPIYTDNGFCLTFSQNDSPHEGHIRVVCDVMHRQGSVKNYFIDLPLDNKGIKGSVNKTDMHATGSAFSYGRRYLTAMIFNLNTADDDDGNRAGEPPVECITEHQIANLEALITEVGADKKTFLEFGGVASLSEIFTCNYQKAINALEAKR